MTRGQVLTVSAMVAASLMIGMDFTGAAAVVTSIEDDFGTDLTATQWILTLYGLAFGMGIVTGGKLGDVFGHRRVLLVGLAVFGAASLTVALAPEVWVAIGARGVQGAGGALIWPSIVAIAFNSVPPAMSSTAVGFVLGGAGLGNVLGPFVAGASADFSTWRVLFWVNLPVVIAVTALVLADVPGRRARPDRRPLDMRGIALLALALLSTMLALDLGGSAGFASGGVLALFALGAAGFSAFAFVEPRAGDPLIPPELIRRPGFVAALLANGLLVPVWFSAFLYIPQYLQKSLDYSAFLGAVGLVPAMVVFAVLSPVSGRFYATLGPRRLIGLGYIAIAAAGVDFALAQPSWGYLGVLPGLLLLGAGAGLAIANAGTAAVSAVDEAHSGLAGGLSFMVHLLFGSIGVAIGTALFASVADQDARGAEFATGMHAVFTFAAAAAAVGIVVTYFIRAENVRMNAT